ncbi:sodium:proton antiporter [Bacillus shivajii]|uniref:sodium:proton antiporter n=1 Tax=Bacillus shivajii TaxID=1983719 RepID=UPI001CFAC6D4|nr:sodium:proton antiporter [Bacillus shivajii]UCZ54553.1 sodium:proton antiporter [Bacillus shivajii]
MQRWVGFLVIFLTIFGLYKYKYRLLNLFLSRQWLRRLSIAFVMRIPAVRQKMMYQMLR